jgi:hypothetical protein
MVPLLSAASQAFGISLMALRAIAALSAAACVYVVCLIVRELDGGEFAQGFAAIVAFFTPVLMDFGAKVSTDTIGLWAWPLLALFLIRLVKGGDPRNWLGAGAAFGIAIESKYSVLFFAAALGAGLLLSPQRRIFATPWFAAGAALGAAIALPNLAWQAVHGFPMLELLRNGQMGKNVMLSPIQFLLQQVLLLDPLLTIVPLVGLVWLLLAPRWRWLGYAYIVLMAMMIVSHGKNYYPADAYPYLIAAGAIPFERWTARYAIVARPAAIALAIIAGAWLVPATVPVLSERAYISYITAVKTALHVGDVAQEHRKQNALGQDYADMHGWPELAATVARVYRSLPPAERRIAVIKTPNYGEAAAIDFFGAQYGLPPAISGHNQYYLWGTHGYTGDVLIDVHGDCGAAAHFFRHSTRAAVVSNPYAMPDENGIPIMVCTGIKEPLARIWPDQKVYE